MKVNMVPETTKFSEIQFSWNNGNDTLCLRDKELGEAMKIAKDFGYRPLSLFRPSTWENVCVAFGGQFLGIGEYGDFNYYRVTTKQQKLLMK